MLKIEVLVEQSKTSLYRSLLLFHNLLLVIVGYVTN
jgi:hypothetical protein